MTVQLIIANVSVIEITFYSMFFILTSLAIYYKNIHIALPNKSNIVKLTDNMLSIYDRYIVVKFYDSCYSIFPIVKIIYMTIDIFA